MLECPVHESLRNGECVAAGRLGDCCAYLLIVERMMLLVASGNSAPVHMHLAPYMGTETVEDLPAGLVTFMTTHDGLRTRIMPGNWLSRLSQA